MVGVVTEVLAISTGMKSRIRRSEAERKSDVRLWLHREMSKNCFKSSGDHH